MNRTAQNPFNVTKAVDFSDQEIHDHWVDTPQGFFMEMIKPSSPMPMMILGGKGSGKTHLMRHFSYPLQKIRHSEDVIDGIREEGYVGIYFRCSGLNAGRFSGKDQPDEKWAVVFEYYMELWVAQLLLHTIDDAICGHPEQEQFDSTVCEAIWNLFDSKPADKTTTLSEIISILKELQQQVDREVNNCVISEKLEVDIKITRGSLIFGIPRIIANCLPSFKKIQFLYLVDELENLTVPQQKYINTLVREKEPPTSFRIGARLYGIRTLSTYSADEENRKGSEYEEIRLDALLRGNRKGYKAFSEHLITRRLDQARFLPLDSVTPDEIDLSAFFETYRKRPLAEIETAFVQENYADRERPYFEKLRRKLEAGMKAKVAWDVSSGKQIEEIIDNLEVPDYPLLEKTNIWLFYQDWFKKKSLPASAAEIRERCAAYLSNRSKRSRHWKAIDHFHADLIAQLYRECRQPQRYLGLDTFIKMSQGLPRNLLIILKHIYKWSVFYGESPFREKGSISIRSQKSGINDASEWFFRDAQPAGKDGPIVMEGINRLAELFREIRFSDKPPECSLCTFSYDKSKCSEQAQRIIETAENYSLLTSFGGRKDRNSMRVDMKYQINSMLAPRWDLPVARRSVIALNPREVNAIFDPNHRSEFEELKKIRRERMTAPFFGKRINKTRGQELPEQTMLPGFEA